jgi:hypothetical protein
MKTIPATECEHSWRIREYRRATLTNVCVCVWVSYFRNTGHNTHVFIHSFFLTHASSTAITSHTFLQKLEVRHILLWSDVSDERTYTQASPTTPYPLSIFPVHLLLVRSHPHPQIYPRHVTLSGILHAPFELWRWRELPSKRREPITQRRSIIPHNNGILCYIQTRST